MKYGKLKIIFFILCLPTSTRVLAQKDAYLNELVKVVENIQNANGNKSIYNNAVDKLSEDGKPYITLMDDLGCDNNEYRGKFSDKFRLNAVVTHAYGVQRGTNLSKGNYFDSKELGVKYSLFEKTVKPGGKVVYEINGHKGMQEFVVIPFKNTTPYNVSIKYLGNENPRIDKIVNGKKHTLFYIDKVKPQGIIRIAIENNGTQFESFAIINYNERK